MVRSSRVPASAAVGFAIVMSATVPAAVACASRTSATTAIAASGTPLVPGTPRASGQRLGSWSALRDELRPVLADASAHHVVMGISVRDLAGPRADGALDLGDQRPYKAASTIKLGVASLIMKGVDDRRWRLDTPVTVAPGDIVGGAGTLQREGTSAFPQRVTLGRLLQLMITVSDNTATNVLIGFAGGFDRINRFTRSLGLADSGFHLGRKMILPHSPKQENWISPAEDADLLAKIYRGTFLSSASRAKIISWMRQQQVNTKFGAVIPRRYLANKTGELADVSHDTGYLLVPGHEVALSVMTSFDPADFPDGSGFATANTEVQKAAKAVYGHLTSHPRAR